MPNAKERSKSFRFTPNIENMDKFQKENLVELAETLTYNYYSNSFGDEFNTFIAKSSDIFRDLNIAQNFEKKFDKQERVRNILVVGAGASHDSYKAFPVGRHLIEEVITTYETEIKTIPFLKEKFDTIESEIIDITRKEQLNFENYLYLLSNHFVTQRELREKIKEMTGFRYCISLFNEIVAHLLKHAFVDVVINFNFEETLDHSIDEEIGEGNYHKIISDGNCVGLEQVLVDGRLKIPIYIKPHGTFSHKSTLRFTNRHYFDLPNDIRTMLEGLLSGQRGEKEKRRGKKDIQRVNVICIGFALESLEFNKILNNFLPPESVIYNINLHPEKNAENFFKDRSLGNFLDRASRHGRKLMGGENQVYRAISTDNFLQNETSVKKNKNPGNTLTSPLGELFSVLWRISYDLFKDSYKPRSIARHEILSYLFYETDQGLSNVRAGETSVNQTRKDRDHLQEFIETNPEFFRDRILVELALSLNRANGIIDIAELLKGKIGSYYQKYEEACEIFPLKIGNKHTIFELVNQFSVTRFNMYMGLQGRAKLKYITESPEEYKYGKNLFALESLFTKAELQNPERFSKKMEMYSDDLKKTMKMRLFTEEEEPINEFPVLSQAIDSFVNSFMFIVTSWKSALKTTYENTKFNRTITIFYLLFQSPLLSRHFKINFLSNFNKKVYNGKKYGSDDVPYLDKVPNAPGGQIMLCELFRLFFKSANQHYYVINPMPYSPEHYLWESFKKRNLIHTKLGHSSEFNHLFLEADSDCLLLVSDTGSLLNFLQKIEPKDREKVSGLCARKHVILICSFEAVRQLYPEVKEGEILKLMESHKRQLCTTPGGIFHFKSLTIMFVNFNQHNHHTTIFLKSLPPADYDSGIGGKFTIITNDTGKYYFNTVGSLYNYRRGFSNSIAPIHIGMADKETTDAKIYRDQEKLIDIFALHLKKAIQFEQLNKVKRDREGDILHRFKEQYIQASGNEDFTKRFLISLYNQIRGSASK
jgi:hypothetical protein